MILSDRDIKSRLLTVNEAGLLVDFLEQLQQGEVSPELDKALDEGHIVIDPTPPEEAFDAESVDLCFGEVLEAPDMPLEVVRVEGKRVIRRFTIDFRTNGDIRRLDHTRKVVIEEQSRIKFIMDKEETFELQPGMMVLAHSREVICIPYDLQMMIGGRSKIARCYVTAHVSSPNFHAGWCGHPVMEVKNDGQFSFNAYPGLPFASVTFHQLSSKAERPYLKKPWASFSGQR